MDVDRTHGGERAGEQQKRRAHNAPPAKRSGRAGTRFQPSRVSAWGTPKEVPGTVWEGADAGVAEPSHELERGALRWPQRVTSAAELKTECVVLRCAESRPSPHTAKIEVGLRIGITRPSRRLAVRLRSRRGSSARASAASCRSSSEPRMTARCDPHGKAQPRGYGLASGGARAAINPTWTP